VRAFLTIALVIGVVVASSACSHGGRGAVAVTTTTKPAPTTTLAPAPLEAGRQVSFYVPAIGDCFDRRVVGAPPSTTTITLVLPCALPHLDEVYATYDYPGADYPGPNVLQQFAKQRCVANFAAYVGAPYETSTLALDYALPDQAGWGNGIRHVVGCLIVDPDGRLRAGSARGSKR
jgi:hypothetical protein